MHSVFYETSKQNNLNSNFFFQIFGVTKNPNEKTTKFIINNSDTNNSTLQNGTLIKRKEEFSDSTQKISQPRVFTKSRDECLNRKAVSSLNFFQQYSKSNKNPKEIEEYNGNSKEKIDKLYFSNKKSSALSQLLVSNNKIKKKFCLKDLVDES